MSEDASKIIAYMHCVKCTEENHATDKVVLGLIDPYTLRIWCSRHNMKIADFELKTPITPYCDVCGEEIGPDHHLKH